MAVLADRCKDIKVTLVDIDKKRINAWNDKDLSKLPVFEPGLKEIIKRNRNKNLFFSTDIANTIKEADMIFISVNTPTKTSGFGAGYASDLKWVESSARQVAEYSSGHTIVVEKSTVPVRTAELIQNILSESEENSFISNIKKSFSVLSSPEFLAEGTAINDLENPDRVLIGGEDNNAMRSLSGIYERWIPANKILFTNVWSSELSKLTANAFLAQRLSSINAISALCEATGAEIKEVSNAIGADKRIGKKFLDAGPGFGGSCFQKDILNLVYLCQYYGLEKISRYWEHVLIVNNWQKERIASLVVEKLFGTVTNKKIAMFGFAFKANTNDTRESPSISIAKDLLENGANLMINDPQVLPYQIEKELCKKESKIFSEKEGSWSFNSNLNECVKDADALIILTAWDEYKEINFEKFSKLMRKPSWVFDTRKIISKNSLKGTGIKFWQVGMGECSSL
ncbi:nucleotide sugar dehydrogenase [Prochlorococcus marinus str. MU1405]|nr:nucleotide sugar dehydrogenase [Prochlorococcus marinus XMU1405]MBW3040811.1 nucleotide sugar dehydrogenase [Prochlorococcus marinus str. MU1405]MBW3048270.1 nucleotide sugar dehydrogenase [Prochlorococcus marinus str. MU1406]